VTFHISIFFIVLCVAVGAYANVTGRNFWLWAGISVLITPFLASIILMIFHVSKGKIEKSSV